MSLLSQVARVALGFLLFALSGCASLFTPDACKRWKEEGYFYITMDSCTTCYRELGNDRDAVLGCGMGLDMTKMMGK